MREAIERLLGPQAEQLKGELAQALLVELAAQPAMTELVDNALEAVSSPDMLPIPLIIGAVLVYLATIKTREQTSTTVDPTTGAQTTTRTIERQNLASLSQLTGNVSDILTKLKGL